MTDAATKGAGRSQVLATIQESTAMLLTHAGLVEALGALILRPHLQLQHLHHRQLQLLLQLLQHRVQLTVQHPMI
jgi:hypothetical protein